MSGITFLCFLQGVEKPFYVTVDETDTIILLKDTILLRKKKIVINTLDVNKLKIWKVSIPSDDITGLQKVPAEVVNPVELRDDKLVSDVMNGIRNDNNIPVFVGEEVKKIPSLEDEIKELKSITSKLTEHIQDLVHSQAQMREDIQRLTDSFENLNINNGRKHHPTVNTILSYREEIKRLFNAYRDKNNLKFTEMARNAYDRQEGRSISADTISDFLEGRSNLGTEENKKAMIHIYYELLEIERLAKQL